MYTKRILILNYIIDRSRCTKISFAYMQIRPVPFPLHSYDTTRDKKEAYVINSRDFVERDWESTHRALTEVGFPTSSMDGFLEWNHEWNSLLFIRSCINAGWLYVVAHIWFADCHISRTLADSWGFSSTGVFTDSRDSLEFLRRGNRAYICLYRFRIAMSHLCILCATGDHRAQFLNLYTRRSLSSAFVCR